MTFSKFVTRASVATSIALVATLAHAQAQESAARDILDMDSQLAKRAMEAQLSPPAPAGVSAAPAAVPDKPAAPKTTLLMGVDGRRVGQPLHLISYVQWAGHVYPADVGTLIRGYHVTSITERGTTLSKGSQHVFAPLDLDGEDVAAGDSAPLETKHVSQAPVPSIPVPPTAATATPVFLPTPHAPSVASN
jgi:hypothetical protein